ncbi:MAG: hypothetical protein DCC55_24475 [Chloroflexi bacterium]|nr:MAG: hypothetical protein DCC55_24475 [Chloroflexota bacterium]
MGNNNPSRRKIDRRLVAQPITSGVRTIELVAHMSGWQWSGGSETSSQGGAIVRIRPVELRVREGEETRTIPFNDPVRSALTGIVFSAVSVSLFCWLIMFVTQRLAQRR